MGIFSNLRKQADDNVGIPDVDAWLNEDGDVALEDALPDLPPPPQAPEMEDRRAPAPDAIVPSDPSPAEVAPVEDSGESDSGGLWNLPDFDEEGAAESGAIPDLAPPSSSLPSIAEIAQGIPPAGSGFPTPDSHQGFGPPDAVSPFDSAPQSQGPSTGFEGLSQAVGVNSPSEPAAEVPLAPAVDGNDVRWDMDVVKYEAEVPAALQATEPGRIPMPVIPPPDMAIGDQPELPADTGFSADLGFGTELPTNSADELHAPMPMPVIPPAGLEAPDAPLAEGDPAWAVSPDTDFSETDFSETGFGETGFGETGFGETDLGETDVSLEDRLGESSLFTDVPDVPSMPTADAFAATPTVATDAPEPAATEEDDAGFSLSNFFGRKKPKDTEADGFADLYEPVADDPFGDNVGLGNTDAATGMEAFDAPVLDDVAAPAELDVPFAIDEPTESIEAFTGDASAADALDVAPDFDIESSDTESFDTEAFTGEAFEAESFDTETFSGEAFETDTFDGETLAGQPLSTEPLNDDAFGETALSGSENEVPAAPAWGTADLGEITPDLADASTDSLANDDVPADYVPADDSVGLDLTEHASETPAPQEPALVIASLNEMSLANLEMPAGPQAGMLLEILGLSEGATWEEARDARRVLIAEHNPNAASDDERAALAKAICREMNTAYAALRLLQVP